MSFTSFISSLFGGQSVPKSVPVVSLTDNGLAVASPEVIKGMITASDAHILEAKAMIAKRTGDKAVLGTLLEFFQPAA